MHKIIWTIEILPNEHEINREHLIHMIENLIFKYVLLWLIDLGKKSAGTDLDGHLNSS